MAQPMQLRIDQVGLPAGIPGRSRTDGLSSGALVTLTNTGSGTTTLIRLLWVPPGDVGAVATLAPTGDPKVWTFSPTAARYGSYEIELVEDAGRATQRIERRVFGVRTESARLLIPALNETADPLASLLNTNVADAVNNSVDFLDAALNAVSYAGWWRSLSEVITAVENGGGNIGRLAVEADTAALFRFDRSLSDIGPNNIALIIAATGPRYSPLMPGLWGLDTRFTTDQFRSAANVAALALTGAMTVECMLFTGSHSSTGATNNRFVYYGSTGVHNSAWEFGFYMSDAEGDFRWRQQSGAGVNSDYNLDGFLPGVGVVAHVAVTRTAGQVVQLYINGEACGAPSSALTTPEPGVGSTLNIGGNQQASTMRMADLRVSNTAHSAVKVKADYNATLGRRFGRLA